MVHSADQVFAGTLLILISLLGTRADDLGAVLLELPLPVTDHVGVDLLFRCQLRKLPVALDRLKGNFDLELLGAAITLGFSNFFPLSGHQTSLLRVVFSSWDSLYIT